MTVLDLTHHIDREIPVYPGTEPPLFTTPCTVEKEGFRETRIALYSHTGTHVDAPAHIIPGARTLDHLSVDHFLGRGCVIDLTAVRRAEIGIDRLRPHEKIVGKSDFVLLRTGWSELWGHGSYFDGYPVLTAEAATWLGGFRLKGLGIDMISVDREGSRDFPVHRILLSREIIIIENLTNLHRLPSEGFQFFCFPLKFNNADGSPVRAVAVVP